LFLLSISAAFTHPTTCALFGISLMAVFGWHFISSKWKLGEAFKADGPMLLSVGLGMIVGLSMWVAGIWGVTGNLKDAAAPPPYTKQFFVNRLHEWVADTRPLITLPLMLIAVVGVILWSRREKKPAPENEIAAVWWLFPLIGALTFLFSPKPVPYYRFMNATAAPVILVGMGAYFLIRFALGAGKKRMAAGVLAGVVVFGALGWMVIDGLQHRWTAENNQFVDQQARVSLAAVHEVAAAAGERPIVLIMNYSDENKPDGTNTAYGWAKTYTNVFRTGLPGTSAEYQATYLGSLENFYKGVFTPGAHDAVNCPAPVDAPAVHVVVPPLACGYTTISHRYFSELQARQKEFTQDPLVFLIPHLIGQLSGGGKFDLSTLPEPGIQVSQDVTVLQGSIAGTKNLWTPPADVVANAQAAAKAEQAAIDTHPGAFGDPLHLLRVLLGIFLLAVLPGLLAAPFFEIEDTPSKLALIPAMSIVMTLLSGIFLLAVWRGSLTPTKAWAVVVLAVGLGAVLRVAKQPVTTKLASFGNFFNKLFSQFSNPDYSTLVGVQFLAQTGQGVVQGAIAKALVFGGQKGFDVQNVPSAQYLLKVVLALYIPYTVISPFVGVFIDRFSRRRVVWWSNIITSVVVGVIALGVMLPLGKGTSEGNTLATVGLVVGLLAAQSVVRVVLAVKSAAIPDVLSGKDLLQGNALSQAGGALFQVLGIGFGGVFAGIVGSWSGVLIGAGIFVAVAFISLRMRHTETSEHETTFMHEASRVVRTVTDGLKEVASRPPAALGLSSFQMLRYQFWGFGLFVFGLYAKNLVQGSSADTLSLALSGLGGIVGGALGLVLAQKWKDKVPPIRMLMGSMFLLGGGTVVFGGLVSVLGFAGMLFVGFFAFFLGKISADTIMQQSMPDDFRGRAFALFDIAYNLGFIVPALILSFIWVEGSATRTRIILIASGVVFLGLTAVIGAWSRRIKDQFAPQDDLVQS
jgi:MFS family permease